MARESSRATELDEFVQRRVEAADEFNRHENRRDGGQVASSLADGLTVVRDLLYRRVHSDVQRAVGMDSMLAPISEEKSEKQAKAEIELYQIAVSAATIQNFDYIKPNGEWYLQWLARFRLGRVQAEGKVRQRLGHYLSKSADGRRLAFTNILASALPESRRAPLVLFRLVPYAVQIVTSLAFNDPPSAEESRRFQVGYLPAINDCRECGGRVLENGEQCRRCGNPLWKFDWLVAVD